MPISFSIDSARRIVRTRVWGRIDDDQVRGLYRHLVADPRFRPDFRHLATIDEGVQLMLHADTIADAARWSPFDAGARRAIVASTDVSFGAARMFALNAERLGQSVRVFRDEAAAERWILAPYPDAVVTTDSHGPRASA